MENKLLLNISIFVISFIVSQIIARLWINFAKKKKIISKGAARDTHTTMTPTMGGISFVIPIVIVFFTSGLFFKFNLLSSCLFSLGFIIILLIGALDDIIGLSPSYKLISQTLGIILIIFSGVYINTLIFPISQPIYLGIVGIIFSFLFILLTVNAFNFIDGLDGLAGGISFTILLTLTYIAYITNQTQIVMINLTALGALGSFLLLNFYPAKLFMGDTGSLFLGLLMVLESIFLFSQGTNTFQILPVFILLFLPLGDALLAFFRRLYAGLSPFHADKKHIHHRFLDMGFSYLETVWSLNALNILFAVLAITIYHFHNSISILLLVGFFSFILFAIIRMGYFNLFHQTIIVFPHKKQNSLDSDETPVPVNLKHLWHKILILSSDIILINISLILTYQWKISNFSFDKVHNIDLAFPVFLLMTFAWIVLFFLNNLYDMPWDFSLFFKLVKTTRIIWFGIVIIGFITFDVNSGLTTSQIKSLFVYGFILTVLVNLGRLMINLIEQKLKILEYSYKKTLLIGSDHHAANLLKDCTSNSNLLYEIVGVVQNKKKHKTFQGHNVLGTYSDLPQIIKNLKIEEIIIVGTNKSEKDINEILAYCSNSNVIIKISPEIKDIFSLYNLEELSGHELLKIFKTPLFYWQKSIKRLTDIIVSLIVITLFFPIALYFYVMSRKKIDHMFFSEEMIGQAGKNFKQYELFIVKNVNDNSSIITIPAIIRRLPSFWLVLKGKMSLVGPRPESSKWYEENFKKLPFIYQRLLVKPGVTGLSQIKYRYFESQKDPLERIKYDLYYFQNLSITLDLRIISRSILLTISDIINSIRRR